MQQPDIKKRIDAIDILRGIVMVIMALDHTRDFFHLSSGNPLDPVTTTPVLFFTRWITHFCAPLFVFLSGVSIYLQRLRKTPSELSAFLLKRGLWLIIAELVIVTLGITFNPLYNLLILQVIWAIGISMVIMSLLVRLPLAVVFAIGVVIVFGHNLLDFAEAAPGFRAGFWWNLLHSGRFALYPIAPNHFIAIMYPFLPWLGLMLIGYAAGTLYATNRTPQQRRKILQYTGIALILFFIVLRFSNIYGDPVPWSAQSNWWRTFLSFLNVFKYPPSLLYMCITIGPAMLMLAWLENINNSITRFFKTYGRTAFFYYLIHFYLIHFLCAIAFFARGHVLNDAIKAAQNSPLLFVLDGEGYSLPVVYLIWIFVVAFLYPLCKKYDRYKTAHKEKKWLSYL